MSLKARYPAVSSLNLMIFHDYFDPHFNGFHVSNILHSWFWSLFYDLRQRDTLTQPILLWDSRENVYTGLNESNLK